MVLNLALPRCTSYCRAHEKGVSANLACAGFTASNN